MLTPNISSRFLHFKGQDSRFCSVGCHRWPTSAGVADFAYNTYEASSFQPGQSCPCVPCVPGRGEDVVFGAVMNSRWSLMDSPVEMRTWSETGWVAMKSILNTEQFYLKYVFPTWLSGWFFRNDAPSFVLLLPPYFLLSTANTTTTTDAASDTVAIAITTIREAVIYWLLGT